MTRQMVPFLFVLMSGVATALAGGSLESLSPEVLRQGVEDGREPELAGTIYMGQTVTGRMPAVDPYSPSPGRMAFSDASPRTYDFTPLAGGPVTIHARSLDFDTRLFLYRVEVNGDLTLVNKDEDCGLGSNSRLRVQLDANIPYRVVVERERENTTYFPHPLTSFCAGEFELSIEAGADALDPLDPPVKPDMEDCRNPDSRQLQRADTDYWEAFKRRAAENIAAECRIESYLRGAYAGAWIWQRPEIDTFVRAAMSLAEKELAADHPLVAEILRPFAEAEAFAILTQPNLSPEDREQVEISRRSQSQKALEIREQWLGADHVDMAWYQVRDFARHVEGARERLEVAEHSVERLRQALGPEHRDVGIALLIQAGLTTQAFTENPLLAGRESVPLFKAALSIFDAELWPWHGLIIHCTNNLTMALLGLGDWAEAKEIYERNLQSREGSLPFIIAVGQYRYAVGLLLPAGYFSEAKEYVEKAMEVFGPYGLDDAEGDVIACHLAHALMLGAMGNHAEAESLLHQIIESREKRGEQDRNFYALLLQELARLKRATGAYDEARDLLEAALAVFERAPSESYRFNTSTNPDDLLRDLGGVLYELGSYEDARDQLVRGVKNIEDMGGADHPGLIDPLNDLALTHHALGAYKEAEKTYLRALDLVRRTFGEEHPQYAEIKSNLARLYMDMGRRSEAMDAAVLAERISRDHTHLTVGALHEEAALAYAAVRSSGLDLAVSLVIPPSDDLRAARAPRSVTVADSPTDTSRVLDSVIRSRALVLDEMAARRRGLDSSDPLVQKWIATSARLANLQVMGPGDNPIAAYQAFLDDARHEKNDAEEALAGASAQFRRKETRRQLGLANVRRALPPDSVLLSYVPYEHYTPGTGGDEAAKTPSFAAFVLRPGESEPTVVPLGSAAEIDALVSSWRLQATTRPGAKAGNREDAEAAYRQQGEALRRRIWDPLAPLVTEAKQVFVVPDGSLNLITLSALPTGPGIFLIDDGPLIHILTTERDLVPEADQASGSRGLLLVGAPAYDATTLFASLTPEQSGTTAVQIASAGLDASPSVTYFRGQRAGCGDLQLKRFEPLPGAAQEAQDVADLWNSAHLDERKPGARDVPRSDATAESGGVSTPGEDEGGLLYLRAAQASESAFKESASDRRILHLATHGFFLGEQCRSVLDGRRGIGGLASSAGTGAQEGGHPAPPPGENPLLLSGLALAGANHREAAGPDEDDGILTAEEIAAMDLSGVEWAVLSACDTGVGEIRAGEGVFGLRRAFQVAGARTLIMSLWSVDDEATREWMSNLYAGRLKQGMSTAEAVHHASLSTLNARRERGESTHPFYWAGFVAAGEWR